MQVFAEIAEAVAGVWTEGGWASAALLAGAVALVAAETWLRPRLAPTVARWVHRGAIAACACVGLALAWRILWLADDAYISLRYAQNFAEGHGLVFNPGEWVEGYTNFLWTLFLGVTGWIGLDMRHVALFGNLAAYVLAVILAAATVRKVAPDRPLVPFAAVALGGSLPFTTFASSGLETMPVAMLVALGMWASTLRHGALWSGLALIAAVMARPDHAVIYGAMALALVAEDLIHRTGNLFARLQWRRYLAYAAPFVLVYVPYFLWRWNAYGDFYPNTYYAKSGMLAYWEHGRVYAWHFLLAGGGWALLAGLLLGAIGGRRSPDETRLRIFALVGVAAFATYVMRVGGDFMQWRFFVPTMPVAAIAAEIGLRWRAAELPASKRVRALAFAACCILLTGAVRHVELMKPWTPRWRMMAEHTVYPIRSLFPFEQETSFFTRALEVKRALSDNGLYPRLAYPFVGMMSYYTKVPIVDLLGLTNERIARKPISRRGTPGHEKLADYEDVMAEGAVLAFHTFQGAEFAAETQVELSGVRFHLLRWDPEFVEGASKVEGAKLPDPAADVRRIAERSPREQVVIARSFYRRFLERHPEREALLALLDERLLSVAEFEEDELPGGARSEQGRFHVQRRTIGDVRPLPPGASGRGVLASGGGTDALSLELGVLRHPELRFAIGGPRSERLRVELHVDGEAVRSESPDGGPSLSPRRWDVRPWLGRQATLRLIDADPGPQAELLVDAIHFADELPPTDDEELLAVRIWDAAHTLPRGEIELPPGWIRYSFDEGFPAGTEVLGNAFGAFPVIAPLANQAPIHRAIGPFANSYHGGDTSQGRLELPEIELPARIYALVGGGDNCSRTFVGVQVGKRIVARACGTDQEILRPAVLDLSGYAGQRGRVVIVDQDGGAWGHILADEILVPPPPEATTSDVAQAATAAQRPAVVPAGPVPKLGRDVRIRPSVPRSVAPSERATPVAPRDAAAE